MRVYLICLLVLATAVGTVAGGPVDGFEISIDGSHETPSETVTVEGEAFTVTAISTVKPGENLTVHVTAPETEEYQINLYNAQRQVQAFRQASGNETVTFETDRLEPGSYVVAAADNEEFHAVHPVVVTDYGIELTIPGRVQTDASFEATVELEPISGETTPGEIELVFWNGATRERYSMTQVDDTTFETTVPGLPGGTYDVYAVVIAPEPVDGRKNAIGLSSPLTLPVGDALTPTPTATTPTATATTPSQTPTATVVTTTTPVPTGTPADTVITPRNGSTPDSVDDDGAGFGIGVTFVGMLCAIWLGHWQVSGPVSVVSNSRERWSETFTD